MAESIDGTIRSVKYTGRSFDGGTFTIAKIDGNQTVMGDLDDPREGETYRFFGEWAATKPPYKGNDFKFTSCEVIVDMSTDGVAQYLKNYIDGLGVVKATAIVETFGTDTLTILRETPERAAEVPRITDAIIEAIREHFDKQAANDPATEARLLEMFRGQKFPRRIVKQLMRAYRGSAPDKVLANPYLLLQFRGVGWKLVDSFALTVAGYARPGIERHMGAIKEAFETLANDGHTCSAMDAVNKIAGGLLGMPVSGQAWAALAKIGDVVAHAICESDQGGSSGKVERMVALARYALAEREVARRVALLLDESVDLPGDLDIHGLAEEQDSAVDVIKANGLAILTGAPGVGKTFVVSKIIDSLINIGVPPESILFLAPFGKSAKRGAELLAENGVKGVTCSTVHKALGPAPIASDPGASKEDAKSDRGREAFGFARNEGNPIEASFIVISEGSTLDIRLAASLLRAIKPGTRVLIEGDENQLPSVGPGAFLRDLMAAGVPSFTLKEIRRSAAAGTVVHACHAIRDGKVPVPADRLDLAANKNWVHIEENDPEKIADIIVNLVGSVKNFDPIWDVQVISPQKTRHPFATGPLNYRLANLLNPVAREATQTVDASEDPAASELPHWHIGDKVIRNSNEFVKEMITEEIWNAAYEAAEEWAPEPFNKQWSFRGVDYAFKKTAIVNGDMGTVIDVIKVGGIGQQVVVSLKAPDRLVRLPRGDANLGQGYTLTTHRCIGSGFPIVIIPVHTSVYSGLATREHFYTTISRVIKGGITVGQMAAIEDMVGRKTVDKRITRLRPMLVAQLAERAQARRLSAERDEAADTLKAILLSNLELVTLGGRDDGETDEESDSTRN